LFIVFLAFAYLVLGDTSPVGEYFTIWPPILWAVPVVALWALGFSFRRWRVSLVPVVALAVFLLLTVEWRSIARGDLPDRGAASRGSSLRLISWNVNGGSDGNDGTLTALERERPDVCVLQESPDGSGTFLSRKPTGYFEGFHCQDIGDCAILSRYPIRALPTRKVGPWPEPLPVALDLPSSRTILLCSVHLALPSCTFNVVTRANRRFFLGSHRDRIAQFPTLADLIGELQRDADYAGVIVAGDFNTPGGARSLNPLRLIATDVWPEAGVGWGATMTSDFPVSRIDQCWVGGGVKLARAWVGKPSISDHRMLIVDLRVD
jgi:endonuclease/exonuclease/phosphatase (EEP) superfamily protein YafD